MYTSFGSLNEVLADLELAIELTRKLRRTPERSLAQDLVWHTQRITRKMRLIPGSLLASSVSATEAARPQSMEELIPAARMLETAIEQETSTVRLLNIQLQIKLASQLLTLLELAQPSIRKQVLDFVWELMPGGENYEKRRTVEDQIELAVVRATVPCIRDVRLMRDTLAMEATMESARPQTVTRELPYERRAVERKTSLD